MSELPAGQPGSRTHYTFTITAREKQAVERFVDAELAKHRGAPQPKVK